MNQKKIKINVESIYQDGGDGGGTFQVYRDKAHYVEEESTGKYAYYTAEEASKNWDKALEGDDPYENGEITNATIELEKINGEWKLAKSFYLHWGQ